MPRQRHHRGDGALYQRPDGLWCAQIEMGYAGGKRKRRTIYDRNYDKAMKKRDAARKERDAGMLSTSSWTVERWLNYWLDEIAAKKVKPRTLRTYRTYVEKWLIPTLGKVKLEKLTANHVDDLHRAMAAKSSTTRLHAHRILGNALEVARKRRLTLHNVVSEMEDAPSRDRSKEREGLDAAEARKVLQAAGDDAMASRWWAALMTGARQGELLGLRWSYVDLDTGTIDIAWSLQRVPYSHGCGAKGKDAWPCGRRFGDRCPSRQLVFTSGVEHVVLESNLCLLPPKTAGSRRVVPLLPAMVAALRLHKERDPASPHDLVWHDEGHPIPPRDDWQRWKDLLKTAGVPDVTLHETRNTTATLLLEAGVDPHVIASILGHSHIISTRGYQRVSLELARRAIGELGKTLGLTA